MLLFDIMFLFIFFESDLPKNLENEFDLFKRLFVLLLLISVDFEDFVWFTCSSHLPSGSGVEINGYKKSLNISSSGCLLSYLLLSVFLLLMKQQNNIHVLKL